MSQSRAAKRTIWIALVAVSSTAAVASYLQALIVVQAADGRTPISYFVAGLADPTIFAASVNLLDAFRQRVRLPRWSMVSVVLALLVTGWLNVAAGSPHSVPPSLIRVWPPVAFLMALESLMSFIRRSREEARPAPCDHEVPDGASTQDKAVAAWLHLRDCEGVEPKFRDVARQLGIHHATAGQLVRAGLNGSA